MVVTRFHKLTSDRILQRLRVTKLVKRCGDAEDLRLKSSFIIPHRGKLLGECWHHDGPSCPNPRTARQDEPEAPGVVLKAVGLVG